MEIRKHILRFIAATLGAVCVFFALAIPLGIVSVCWEGGCTDTRQEHWLRDLLGLSFIGFALCLSSLLVAAALFFYARYGKLRNGGRREPPK